MSYTVIVPKPIQKQLDRLPDDVRDRIIEKIVALAENPRPQGVINVSSEFGVRSSAARTTQTELGRSPTQS